MPNLKLIDRDITLDGGTIGQYAINEETGRICAIKWAVEFRKHSSFAFTASLLEEIEAEKIFIVDKSDNSVYLFDKQDYLDGPMVKENGEFQYILPKSEHIEKFESLDEILK